MGDPGGRHEGRRDLRRALPRYFRGMEPASPRRRRSDRAIAGSQVMIRLFEKFELWLRHRADRMPDTAYGYYCNVPITAPNDTIVEVIQSHLRHPAHKAAQARKEDRNG